MMGDRLRCQDCGADVLEIPWPHTVERVGLVQCALHSDCGLPTVEDTLFGWDWDNSTLGQRLAAPPFAVLGRVEA
jgi:hypothetical protein